ncbi:MAG: hypothetical protein ACI392_06595 [Paludibacteraceae bacterium]
MKNPFKKQNVMDTVVTVGLGGAANVAIDAVVDSYNKSATTPVDDIYVHAGKFIVGAIGSAMIGNRYAKAALDGVGVVGASNLIAYLMDDTTKSTPETTTAGIPHGTVGRVRTANAGYARRMRRSGRVAGIANMVG